VNPAFGGLREPILTFAAATGLAAGLAALGGAVSLVRENLHVLIAVVFFYAPSVGARISGRGFDAHAAGLRTDPVGLNAKVLLLAIAVTFPLFVLGFFGFYGTVCGGAAGGPLAPVASAFASLCDRWVGLSGGALTLPSSFLLLALNQLIVIAVPEEFFFRGYLMSRLEERWPSRRRLLGAPVGVALVVSSLLFALGHLIVVPNAQRLAVFFPGLVFGWMRARTGSIAAGAAFHALCNLFADTLHTSYFR
jgi:membrane protease YdiL (CAAX protease family)